MKNPVVHFEIYARDAEKLATFYSTLFDWSIEAMPGMDYHYVKTTDTDDKGVPTQPGINGGLVVRPAGYDDKGWINYINVDSLDAAVTRAHGLGAKVMKPRAAVPGMGWFAMLVDPQGNTFAMWERDPNAK
jgi:predicted enzyme related to lactoylglutathione lyase